MRKVAFLFLVAVLAPSLALAFLAMRSLRDQQFVLERQQALLHQATTDALAESIRSFVIEIQREFSQRVEKLVADRRMREMAPDFDFQIRQGWTLPEVGFVVSLDGTILAPSSLDGSKAKRFLTDNSLFLNNRETVEVYQSKAPAANYVSQSESSFNSALLEKKQYAPKPVPSGISQEKKTSQYRDNLSLKQDYEMDGKQADTPSLSVSRDKTFEEASSHSSSIPESKDTIRSRREYNPAPTDMDEMKSSAPVLPEQNTFGRTAQDEPAQPEPVRRDAGVSSRETTKKSEEKKVLESVPSKIVEAAKIKNRSQDLNLKNSLARNVIPQKDMQPQAQSLSRIESQQAEFRQLVGDSTEGALARFLQNELKLMLWYRSPRDPQLIFGIQINLSQLRQKVTEIVFNFKQPNGDEICLAILDDKGKPVARSMPNYVTDWKHPFVAAEIGEVLPHWEVAAYLIHPQKLNQAAETIKFTLGLMVLVLVLAIVVGGWLIFTDLHRQVKLARQKTDFVSNVSHELKTPLTSIRLFSDLLTSGKPVETKKQHTYLRIISSEASRLTRLINNVLDFARMERGEKKYDMQFCDLMEIVHESVANYKPHLEANGFHFTLESVSESCPVQVDRDAIGQIILNLLSNAEKYGGESRQINLKVCHSSDQRWVQVYIMDRGSGIPCGCEEKIFEQFYRAHNSLHSGIQGSGLGLTLARQIARAHGGTVRYEARTGGGSSFILELPIYSAPNI